MEKSKKFNIKRQYFFSKEKLLQDEVCKRIYEIPNSSTRFWVDLIDGKMVEKFIDKRTRGMITVDGFTYLVIKDWCIDSAEKGENIN
jgi:hypothetical protein